MELIVAGQTGEMHDVVRRMAAAGHFDTPPADVLEVIEETAHIGTGHLVARRVSHNGGTHGNVDPANRYIQRCPAMIEKTRLAWRQLMLENTRHIAGNANRHQVASKMGARNQARVGHKTKGTFIDAGNTDGGERVTHPPGALDATDA